MRDVQTKFPRGKVVRDRYIVEELLGKGGFGAVYRVRDRRVKSNVFALKELVDPDKQQRDSFAFECEILKRLDHRALPRVYRVFEDNKNNRVYMLMDYIEGANLEKLRRQQPEWRFPLPQVMKMMAPIVDAIIYLHAQHPPIVHRDIKPSNIIVPSTGDGSVLVDFGIAKEYDQDATTMAVRHCSPGYGAPEQYARGTDTRTDIYGLAATFYTLLTGEVPVDALLRMTRLGSKYSDPLEPVTAHVPTIPSFIADALQCAMSININDRFATVEEFWQALNAYPIEEPTIEEQEQPSEPIPKLETLVPVDEPVNMDLPAMPVTQPVSASTISMYEEPQTKPIGKGKNRLLALVLTALALVALLTGAAFGARMLPGIGRSPVSITTSTIKPALTATQAILEATPTPQPTATPTPTPTSSLTLAGQYDGTIIDRYVNPPLSASMSLLHVQQDGSQISGDFVLGPQLIGNGHFTGTVSANNKIQFIVAEAGTRLPLFFQGQIHTDGSISGTYCSYQNNQCNYGGGGYGDWNVASPASQ